MPEAGLKMRIDFDKSTFYSQNANNRWVVAGREYNYMFDGASKMYRSKAGIVMDPQLDIEKNTTTVIRTTPYIRGPVIVDTYVFDGKVDNIELFPISHTVEIYNATGYYYKYDVRDLTYDGDTFKFDKDTTSMNFGKNMKVEWWEGFRLGWVYKSGSMYVKSEKIDSDYAKFNIRLFDPILEDIRVEECVYKYATEPVKVIKYHMVDYSYDTPVYKEVNEEYACDPKNNTCETKCVDTKIAEYCYTRVVKEIDHYDTTVKIVNESYVEIEQVPYKIIGCEKDGELKRVYNDVYTQLSRQVPIYTTKIIEHESTYSEENDTWSEPWNESIKSISGYTTEYYDGRKIGIEDSAKKEYISEWQNVDNTNKLNEWAVPIGDRNLEEFGDCREYEMNKFKPDGTPICKKTDLMPIFTREESPVAVASK